MVAIFFALGCSSQNCIQDGSRYMSENRKVHKLCSLKNYIKAAKIIKDTPPQDDMLYSIDKAMIEHRSGQFTKSQNTIERSYTTLKLSAETELSSGFFKSVVSGLGSVVDQLLNTNLIGTGTYRYAYGLQLWGETAKYHLSTSEVSRVAAFQLLNTIQTDDENAGRIAMLNLSDMHKFQTDYLNEFPFIDQSFFDLVSLIYFNQLKDSAGNAPVAYNRAIEEQARATEKLLVENSFLKTKQNLLSTINMFDNIYSRNMQSDIRSYINVNNNRLSWSEIIAS